jgi:hypothetical protein
MEMTDLYAGIPFIKIGNRVIIVFAGRLPFRLIPQVSERQVLHGLALPKPAFAHACRIQVPHEYP